MDYIDKILKKYCLLSDVEKRKAVFFYVRDIPYRITGSQEPHDLYRRQEGECAAKAKLLSLLFRRMGYKTRFLLVRYRLRDFPQEVMFIPGQIDYHHALQILVNGAWVGVDATYDSGLRGKGFVVNDWNGIDSTKLCEKPVAIKIRGKRSPKFDLEFRKYITELKTAVKNYPNELDIYTKKFNEEIKRLRKN